MIENREPKYWPFEVLSQEKQSDQHRSEIRFLESAFQLGYKPYIFYGVNYGASSESGRVSEIVVLGRTRWEIVLGGPNKEGGSAFVDNFECAANASIAWLMGGDAVEIFSSIQDHLIVMRSGRSFRLWSDPVELLWPKTKPCPYCGKLLRTEKALQCFMCGMDWHDSNRIVQHVLAKTTNKRRRWWPVVVRVGILLVLAIALYQTRPGIRVTIQNTGSSKMGSVVLHITAKSYPLGDIPASGSAKATIYPGGKNHLEIEFTDVAGNRNRLNAGGYFDGYSKGTIQVSIKDGVIEKNEQKLEMAYW